MLWARVILGRSSSANEVTFPEPIFRTTSGLRFAKSVEIETVPGFIWATSSTVGGCTPSTIEAFPRSAARSVTRVAPTFWNSASGYPASVPAPASRATSTPLLTSFPATSGVSATRCSPGRTSLATTMRTDMGLDRARGGREGYTITGVSRSDTRSRE